MNQLLKDPERPKLCSEAKHSEVSAGGSAMLELQIRGYPKPDIKWTKDGQEIVAGGKYKYLWEDEESMSLVIKNVTAKDAGVYTIRAKNELGEDTTQIELIVKSAPKITRRQTDTTCIVDETLTMTVEIEATPAPEVKWYKDGQEIKENNRIIIEREGNETYKLTIKNARLDDTGSYSIVARNEVNQTTEIWKLKVLSPPRIRKGLGEPVIIDQGANLVLTVEVDSVMPPSIKWYRDGEPVVEDNRIKMTKEGNRFVLRIVNTVSEDAGFYKAEITSDHGVVTDQTRIRVIYICYFERDTFYTIVFQLSLIRPGERYPAFQNEDVRRDGERRDEGHRVQGGDRWVSTAEHSLVHRRRGDHGEAKRIRSKGGGGILHVDHFGS